MLRVPERALPGRRNDFAKRLEPSTQPVTVDNVGEPALPDRTSLSLHEARVAQAAGRLGEPDGQEPGGFASRCTGRQCALELDFDTQRRMACPTARQPNPLRDVLAVPLGNAHDCAGSRRLRAGSREAAEDDWCDMITWLERRASAPIPSLSPLFAANPRWSMSDSLPSLLPAIVAAQGGGSSPAFYTLFGAVTTGVATLIGLVIKHRWDVAAELRSREDDRETLRSNHEYELARLEHELSAARSASQRATIREVCGRFLASVHDIYSAIADARRVRRLTDDDAAFRAAITAIDPSQGQSALEELRLVADEPLIAAAQALWGLVRGDEVAMGVDLESRTWVDWKGRYWDHRIAVVAAAREAVHSE